MTTSRPSKRSYGKVPEIISPDNEINTTNTIPQVTTKDINQKLNSKNKLNEVKEGIEYHAAESPRNNQSSVINKASNVSKKALFKLEIKNDTGRTCEYLDKRDVKTPRQMGKLILENLGGIDFIAINSQELQIICKSGSIPCKFTTGLLDLKLSINSNAMFTISSTNGTTYTGELLPEIRNVSLSSPVDRAIVIDAVASRLAPYIHLDSNEHYKPCDPEKYLAQCVVLREDPNASDESEPEERWKPIRNPIKVGDDLSGLSDFKDNLTLQVVNAEAGTEHPNAAYSQINPASSVPRSPYVKIYNGELESLNKVPTFYRVNNVDGNENSVDITYYFFYAYNGGILVSGLSENNSALPQSGFGSHEGDWESVTAIVTWGMHSGLRHNKISLSNLEFTLEKVGYQYHGDYDWAERPSSRNINQRVNDLESINVYSAWHSHASYGTVGEHKRKLPQIESRGLREYLEEALKDKCDGNGLSWDTSKTLYQVGNIHYPLWDPAWVKYPGRWGTPYIMMSPYSHLSDDAHKRVVGPQGPNSQTPWQGEFNGVKLSSRPTLSSISEHSEESKSLESVYTEERVEPLSVSLNVFLHNHRLELLEWIKNQEQANKQASESKESSIVSAQYRSSLLADTLAYWEELLKPYPDELDQTSFLGIGYSSVNKRLCDSYIREGSQYVLEPKTGPDSGCVFETTLISDSKSKEDFLNKMSFDLEDKYDYLLDISLHRVYLVCSHNILKEKRILKQHTNMRSASPKSGSDLVNFYKKYGNEFIFSIDIGRTLDIIICWEASNLEDVERIISAIKEAIPNKSQLVFEDLFSVLDIGMFEVTMIQNPSAYTDQIFRIEQNDEHVKDIILDKINKFKKTRVDTIVQRYSKPYSSLMSSTDSESLRLSQDMMRRLVQIKRELFFIQRSALGLQSEVTRCKSDTSDTKFNEVYNDCIKQFKNIIRIVTNLILKITHDKSMFLSNEYFQEFMKIEQKHHSLQACLMVFVELRSAIKHHDGYLSIPENGLCSEKVRACTIFSMPHFPDDLKKYRGIYIWIQSYSELHYVNQMGRSEIINIIDKDKFSEMFQRHDKSKANKIYLSKEDAEKLITLNGGHILARTHKIEHGTGIYSCVSSDTKNWKKVAYTLNENSPKSIPGRINKRYFAVKDGTGYFWQPKQGDFVKKWRILSNHKSTFTIAYYRIYSVTEDSVQAALNKVYDSRNRNTFFQPSLAFRQQSINEVAVVDNENLSIQSGIKSR